MTRVDCQTDPRLGRAKEFDERSRMFSVRKILDKTQRPKAVTKYWDCYARLDQLQEGSCVGHAWAHQLAAAPHVEPDITHETAVKIFRRAKLLDPWPGTSYDYTSVLAGAKATVKLYPNEMAGYHWGFGLDDVIHSLSHLGPVVLGLNWYQGMHKVDRQGAIQPAGRITGGHAILAYGVDVENSRVILRNSWGRDWGIEGDCWLSFSDLERLLHEEGEACIAVRVGMV